MTSRPVLLFTGGGTGGHLFPGIALARRWLELHPDTDILFVGSRREAESRILAAHGYPHHPLAAESTSSLRRHPLRFVWHNSRALIQARNILRQRRPLGVVGLGGFASAPLLIAARWLKIPTLLLEQNALPGRANRALARSSKAVCCHFEESLPHFPTGTNTILTGTPLRSEIARLHSVPNTHAKNPSRLLVLGGSLGATPVNSLLIAAAEKIPELRTWEIIHQTGDADADRVRSEYARLQQPARVTPFLDDIAVEYSHATCAVARAGGVTISELGCASLPVILIPLPNSTDNHQHANALHLANRRAAILVEQQSPLERGLDDFIAQLRTLLLDAHRRRELSENIRRAAHPDATEKVIQEIERCFLQKSP